MEKLTNCPATGRKMYWNPTDMILILEETMLNKDIKDVIPECTITELKEAFDKHYDTFKYRYNNNFNTMLLDLSFLRSMDLATALVNRGINVNWGFGWLKKLKKIEAEFPVRTSYRLSHQGYTA